MSGILLGCRLEYKILTKCLWERGLVKSNECSLWSKKESAFILKNGHVFVCTYVSTRDMYLESLSCSLYSNLLPKLYKNSTKALAPPVLLYLTDLLTFWFAYSEISFAEENRRKLCAMSTQQVILFYNYTNDELIIFSR